MRHRIGNADNCQEVRAVATVGSQVAALQSRGWRMTSSEYWGLIRIIILRSHLLPAPDWSQTMKKNLVLLALVAVFLAASSAVATFPRLMNYQGRLDDANGKPLANGNYQVTFRLFSVPTAGSPLWQETQTVTTVEGVFAVLLGSVDSIPDFIFYQDSAYLEIQPAASNAVLPRSRLSTVPYAMRAKDADLLGGAPAASFEESAEIQAAVAEHAANPDAHHHKTIDAGELILGTLSEARLPQHSIDSTEIEPQSIGADKLADEPGIAYSYTTLAFPLALDPAVTVIDSISITVPKSGYMIVTATGWFYKLHTSGGSGSDSYATVSLSVLRTAQSESNSAKFAVLGPMPSGHYDEDFALTRVLPVSAGTTKVFLIGNYSGASGPNIQQMHLTAQYFPTAYGNVDNVASQ